MDDLTPKLPPHGADLLTLELLSWEQKRTIFWDEEKRALVPAGSGAVQVFLRFPGGDPFPVIMGEYDFREFVLTKLHAMEDAKRKTLPPAPVA